ncbi:glycosyl transferase family 28 [Vicingus serpentipes]|uniref:Glycosyl transferase family 28 n=1 Tax=Vicingus serpentipes TaxID=1926625 RepID=A0A5C6RQK0_9FLAO|nr:glycosyltransferase [Vicingus serpentipes]TXB64621.1 glycosyl transferase family 28 [Vicingus serpentipes]
MTNQKTILVCPLDWGLGHATRCIPIIQSFLKDNHKVIIGTSGKQEALLKQEFPYVTFIELKGYNVEYPENGAMISKMLTQLPKIKKAIQEEQEWLAAIIDKYKIDQVVSDNRYGLWNNKIESTLITHQLFIKAPTGEWLIEKILNNYLANFDEVWIPDIEGENNLSGDLAHKKPLPHNYKFIGPLSRFSSLKKACDFSEEYDFIAIVSGPEPQRTIFEKLILEQVRDTNLKGVLVRGLPDSNEKLKIENSAIQIYNHLETNEFLNYLQKSKVVISRSGYSTIMDLATLGKKAILVPTPGQTEQEYLAQYHQEKGQFYTQKQSEFDLEKAVKEVKNYSGFVM